MYGFFFYYSYYLKNIRNGIENMERFLGKEIVCCCYKMIIKFSFKKI